MSDRTILITSEGWEGQNVNTMAHVLGLDNVALALGDVTSINLSIYDISSDTPDTPLYGPTALTVATTIFDPVVKDTYWTRNNVGYNFRYMVSAALFTQDGGHKYRFCYALDTVSWETIWVIHEHHVRGVLGQ
jgi:hypothetical protein